MADTVELADSLADGSIEVVGTVSPGAPPYTIRVSEALQTQIADHETRIDVLEAGAGGGDITAVTAGTGLTGGGTSGAVSLAADFGTGAGEVCEGNDSRLADDRTASGLRTASGIVVVSAAAAPSAGQVLAASGSTAAAWSTLAAATSDAKTRAPSTPDSRDDEFESATLSAVYQLFGSAGTPIAGQPAKVAITYTTAGVPMGYQAHTDRRPSWLTVQGDGGVQYLMKPLTSWGTNDSVRTRIQPMLGVSGNNPTRIWQLCMCAASGVGGVNMDLNNMILLGPENIGVNNYPVVARKIIGGVSTAFDTVNGNVNFGRGDYLMFDKVGTAYHAIWGADTLAAVIIPPGNSPVVTISITMTWVGWKMQSQSSDGMIQPYEIDYLRFSTAGFLGRGF